MAISLESMSVAEFDLRTEALIEVLKERGVIWDDGQGNYPDDDGSLFRSAVGDAFRAAIRVRYPDES